MSWMVTASYPFFSIWEVKACCSIALVREMRRSIACFAGFMIIHGQIEQIVHYRTFRAFCLLTEFRTPRPISYSAYSLTIAGFGDKFDARPRIDPQHTTLGEGDRNHRDHLGTAVCQLAPRRERHSWPRIRWAS